MTRRPLPAYWKALRVIARTLARHPDLGAPTIQPSLLSRRIADIHAGDGGFAAALAWARVMDDIHCIDVDPFVPDVIVTVTGRLGLYLVQVMVTAHSDTAVAQNHAEITVAQLESLTVDTALAGVS